LAGVNCKLHSPDAWADAKQTAYAAAWAPGWQQQQGHDVMGIPHGRPAVGSQYPVHEDASGAGVRVFWVSDL